MPTKADWMDFFEVMMFVLFCIVCWPFMLLTLLPFSFFEKRPNFKVFCAYSTVLLGLTSWIVVIVISTMNYCGIFG